MPKLYWYAVFTRPRAENAAVAEITALGGFEVYFPQETVQRLHRGKKVPSQRALIPSTIFVGTDVPPILDVLSPNYPHPIYRLLELRSVRELARGAGGAAHPIRPSMIDGWSVNFVDDLRSREAAGEFVKKKEEVAPAEPPFATSLKYAGDKNDQLAVYRARAFGNDHQRRLAA